eukprot:CAMPEP_0194106734 /NCGR_PEP_ID=MMETSP0150-20130528/6709_1 /TAXON_ID=122233 /ORGANISM="Chaetoceros debilis, Strain MM31A-1" /LENGTH=859 /DNA_ID=CAMNT_0038794961 /DNA_START=345 /DNA_END=2924 /DNA_ORIENTATION=-
MSQNEDADEDDNGDINTNTSTSMSMSMSKMASGMMMGMFLFCVSSFVSLSIPNDAIALELEGPLASPPTSSSSSSSNKSMSKSRYWDVLQSSDSDISEIQYANERLIDYAVGTINTMYYDNTGGARFTTKDMFDRWRVMKTYAKEGIGGVREITKGSLGKYVTESQLASSASSDDDSGSGNVPRNAFVPQLFLIEGDTVQVQKQHRQSDEVEGSVKKMKMPSNAFNTREDAVTSLKWLVSTLEDPYSKYLTRDELQKELTFKDDGFLGLGAIVEAPSSYSSSSLSMTTQTQIMMNNDVASPTVMKAKAKSLSKGTGATVAEQQQPISITAKGSNSAGYLSSTRVANLPMVTAIAPDSPAERAGIVVGDRIVAVGSDNFIGFGRDEVSKKINEVYTGAENYIGYPDLTVAKPVKRSMIMAAPQQDNFKPAFVSDITTSTTPAGREELIGYKLSKVRLRTASLEPFKPKSSRVDIPGIIPAASAADQQVISGGNAIVHWELLTSKESIFSKYKLGFDTKDYSDVGVSESNKNVADTGGETDRVGYIRMTRFSRASTAGYLQAVEELERAGAQSYIIDVRNNYGGIIQESMLTASSLLRDPHSVLCYTLNSRGGFTPHDVEEYVVDTRYPGYLLSSESPNVTYEQVKRDDPDFITGNNWYPPSSYASLHEQKMKRNYSRPTGIAAINPFQKRFYEDLKTEQVQQLRSQKKIAILINEGTASAAEVFVSSLHDNGRTVALVGSKTYGKGLIQHTFPMIDGGGLRMTVAEYLTPALQHVTKVGGAQYDRVTGDFVGGGVKPDVYCSSTQGIPSNIGADICVGVAMDALEDASFKDSVQLVTKSKAIRSEELERNTKRSYGFKSQ